MTPMRSRRGPRTIPSSAAFPRGLSRGGRFTLASGWDGRRRADRTARCTGLALRRAEAEPHEPAELGALVCRHLSDGLQRGARTAIQEARAPEGDGERALDLRTD